MELSIENSCRICMQVLEDLFDLFDEHEGRPVSEVVMEVSGVTISFDDSLSKKLCKDCLEKTLDFQAFRQLCIDSDETVRYNLLLDDACDSQSGGHDSIPDDDNISQEYDEALFINELNNDSLVDESGLHQIPILIERLDSRTNASSVSDRFGSDELASKMREAHFAKEQQKKYKCEHCDKFFKFPSKVMRHKLAVHKNMEGPKKTIKKNHCCHICGKAFVSQFKVRRHFKVHDTELKTGLQKNWSKNYLSCGSCQKRFHTQKTFDRHQLVCELLKKSLIDRPEGHEYFCAICAEIYPTHDAMVGCLKAHIPHEHSCVMCPDVIFSYADIVKHCKNHEENATYKCCVCQKLFPNGDEITIHLLRHKEYRPFNCRECGKSFFDKFKLHQHQKTHVENAPKNFVCEFCKRAFSEADYLNCHIRRKHSDSKPFSCTTCDRSFAFLHDLNIHLTNHTGDKKHTCQVCDASFTKSSSLKQHLTHHETNPTDLQCNVCDFIAQSKSRLLTHIANHDAQAEEDTDEVQFAFMEAVNEADSYTLEEMQSTY